jgi:hypothetical protein
MQKKITTIPIKRLDEIERKKEDRKEIQKMLGFSRIGISSPKY